jgi:hypothetical protein
MTRLLLGERLVDVQRHSKVASRARGRRLGLFCGYWTTLDGQRIRRATRAEIGEAYRLWAKHRDIRAGRSRAA